jgi:hypothetical protein
MSQKATKKEKEELGQLLQIAAMVIVAEEEGNQNLFNEAQMRAGEIGFKVSIEG